MLKELMPNGQTGGGVKLGRDRGAVLTTGLLIALAALAWVGVIHESMRIQDSSMMEQEMGMAMSVASSQNMLVEGSAFLLAWGVMMVAMMLPSATPMIALYGTVRRTFSQKGQKAIPTALFALVYLMVWLVFGIPVYAAGITVDTTADIYPAIADLLPYAVAVVLLGAGAYQFSSLKQVCLRVCQSPLAFLSGHWRNGYVGTMCMALEHAVYCVGCCWALMIVLVAAGAMALHWVLLIAALVFVEKILAHGKWTARIVGVALILLGVLVAMQPDLVIVLRGQTM